MILERRMPLLFLGAGAAERDALVDENVVTDFGRLAHYDSHAVIDEQSPPDFRAGMNFDTRDKSRELADDAARQLAVMLPEPMCDAMSPDGVQPRIQQHHFELGARGRVAVENRLDVFPHSAHNTHGTYLFRSEEH